MRMRMRSSPQALSPRTRLHASPHSSHLFRSHTFTVLPTMTDLQERPHKKRRFFVEDPPSPPPHHAAFAAESSLPDEANALPETNGAADVFDADTFRAVVGGEVKGEVLRSLQGRFGSNLEAAVNTYFDGSWKTPSPQKAPASTQRNEPAMFRKLSSKDGSTPRLAPSSKPASPPPPPPALESMPSKLSLIHI